MNITAAMVKELRERTGSGMMECKKALTEANGDMEAAIEHMRKTGLAKADKKAGRVAAEGYVSVKLGADGKAAALVEINSETDFVAKADDFVKFANDVAAAVLATDVSSLDQLLGLPLDGASVDETRRALVAKLGENIAVRRFERYTTADGTLAGYSHGSRIGVLVEMKSGSAELGRDIAMHVAASKPVCLDESGVSADLIAKEKEIFSAQALESGKPADIVEKMVQGRINKFLGEITLLGQPFVKNPDVSVAQLLKEQGAAVSRFVRYEVGEGIEKEESNFAEEVMAQVRGS